MIDGYYCYNMHPYTLCESTYIAHKIKIMFIFWVICKNKPSSGYGRSLYQHKNFDHIIDQFTMCVDVLLNPKAKLTTEN